jgi:predicted aldo/keto reductase-like oxidoreductase
MKYRELGKTGLKVSEIGFGGEWLERHPGEESVELMKYAGEKGINIIDCWMPDPKSRDIIGKAMQSNREGWYVQGHFGSTWQNGQYVRTRDMKYVKPAFEDLLTRLRTDYIDLGMIHFVDTVKDWNLLQGSEYLEYVLEMKEKGVVRHIGMSSHDPKTAALAVRSGLIEMLLFSINPAFDMLPSGQDLEELLGEGYRYDDALSGINSERAELYRLCEEHNVGITVMKGFAGGRLFDGKRSPFGVALTPVQCIHYALTRPGVASVLCGYDTKQQVDEAVSYEEAAEDEKDFASVLSSAPLHSYRGECTYCGHCKPCPSQLDIAMINKYYDLAVMQPQIPESVRSHYMQLEHKASECIGCRQCEERCPFGVPVADRMKEAAKLFDKGGSPSNAFNPN